MRSLLVLLFTSLVVSYSSAQVFLKADSAAVRSDTSKVDSTSIDKDTASVSGVDTLVNYSCADSIVYDIATKTMSMFKNSDINYRQMQLKSELVDVQWNTSELMARGVADTADSVGSDSLKSQTRQPPSNDTTQLTKKTKYKGTPVMKDGSEEYRGFELGYNFKTKKGRIDVGETEIDQGYYHGEEIKKVDKDVLFVENGRYTTCNAPEPHYYFYSPRMKVTMQENVVAEPIYLYISDVPVFVLPLGVFPNKGGRRSGIIAPAYGEDAQRGRFLHHLGYYWAMSDYMDWSVRSDLFTKGGWALYSDYRYVLRYYFNGSLSGEYKKLHTGEPSDPQRTEETSYRINLTHNQDIDPTTRMNVNFTFASNNAYRNTIDIQQALEQSIFSNATLSKYWEGTPNSITLNVARRQNLRDGSIDETLPSLSFNHSQSYPFRSSKSTSQSSELAWYEMIGVGYGMNASNGRAKISRSVAGVKVDSTFQTVQTFERDRHQSLAQNVGIGIAPKVGYVTIAPSFSYSDQRSFSDNDVPTRSILDSSLTFQNVRDARRAGTLSSGVGMSTKFYGIMQPNMLGVAAFRHTVTPSLSFTYQKQVIGDNIGPRQMFANFNVGNVFEMKATSDTGKEGNKIQLLNTGAGLSYNFTADSLRFSEINTSFRTSIGSFLDVGGGANFNLYKLVRNPSGQYVQINKFLLSEERRLARLTHFSLSLSTSLSGERKKPSQPYAGGQSRQIAGGRTDTTAAPKARSGYFGLREEEEPDFSIPWKLSLSWDFGQSNNSPVSISRSSNVRGNLEFNLTENWKFMVNGGYDLINKEVEVPNINISRDLHCWMMNFSWVPLGYYRSYHLEIRVKASQLQDVKVTKSGSERGIY